MRISYKIMITTTMSFMLLLSGFVNLSLGYAEEVDTNNNEIVINLEPKDVLFDITNMKPGDWAPRTLIVKNDGIKDFYYQMRAENMGNDKLYNELLLEIKDNQEQLYHGKLSEFLNLPARELKASNEEELEITIRFPEHLGNEFQGIDSQFAFVFTAEGITEIGNSDQDSQQIGNVVGGEGDSVGGILPNTATTLFNILLIGSILIALGIILLIVKRYRKNFTRDL